MLFSSALIVTSLAIAAPPATRIAVLVDDPDQAQAATATLEKKLQDLGYEVVASDVSQKMRTVIAPKSLLGARLPTEGLSVFEADAILAGAASYGDVNTVEGVKSQPVAMTVRIIDLGTGQATRTMQSEGVGMGIGGPALRTRAVHQAVELLFADRGLKKALEGVGQSAGSVTLIVQDLPNRAALADLRIGLERALAGAPVREIYYARGLGKLVLGGSKAKSMAGPSIADLIGENRGLALVVDEVANTRIVSRYDKSRTVDVHALVLEPKFPRGVRADATELGRFVATQIATFKFAQASYQRGRISRKAAIKRARALGAHVVVESEVLGTKGGRVFALRVVDVKTKKPILRQQRVLDGKDAFGTAQALVAELERALPEKLYSAYAPKVQPRVKPDQDGVAAVPKKAAPEPEDDLK